MGTWALLIALPLAAEPLPPAVFESSEAAAMAHLRTWFMEESAPEPELAFSTADVQAYALPIASLHTLKSHIQFLKAGRVVGQDDWQTYSDMAVILAHRLGVDPPEDAIPVYRGLVRPEDKPLTPEETAIRAELVGSANAPGAPKRYVYIQDLLGAPHPEPPQSQVVFKKTKKGKTVKAAATTSRRARATVRRPRANRPRSTVAARGRRRRRRRAGALPGAHARFAGRASDPPASTPASAGRQQSGSFAVPGINCMRPIAPFGDTASGRYADSTAATLLTNSGRSPCVDAASSINS
jgi:hypothetical protein